MAKKNQSSSLIELLIAFGFFYIIYKVIHDEKLTAEESKKLPGISGLPGRIRYFRAYREGNKEPYREDLMTLDNRLIMDAIDLANKASINSDLKGNWIKWFQGDTISGELISGQIRILFYRIDEFNFILLTVFLKKDNETDKLYKEKARRRIAKIGS